MTQEYQKLQEKIKQVRQRFRWIVLARGLVFSLIASMAVVVVAVFLVDRWNYSDRALSLARVFSALFILAIIAWFLARPLWRRVMDVQIAR
ncbi:MAG: hypothetical protein DMG06_26960, partial [Acidobacteria bacterium]